MLNEHVELHVHYNETNVGLIYLFTILGLLQRSLLVLMLLDIFISELREKVYYLFIVQTQM